MIDKNTKVLITGCGGMLGDALFERASKNYSNVLATDINLTEPWLQYLDVRDKDAVTKTFQEYNPQIVFHLAALTDLEYCEQNPDEAWNTNALGTESIAKLAKKSGALMIYISTAGVFDGTKNEYTEDDIPNPISVYGKSKRHGETYIQSNLTKYFIFRAGWMFGGGPNKDKKFINKIYSQIKSGITELYVIDDKLGTPTYTFDFSNAMLKIIKTPHFGLFNQSGKGATNRYEVAREFVNFLGLKDTIRVSKTTSNYFNRDYFAPRPHSEVIISKKLNDLGMNYMRQWEDALKEYSEVFKK